MILIVSVSHTPRAGFHLAIGFTQDTSAVRARGPFVLSSLSLVFSAEHSASCFALHSVAPFARRGCEALSASSSIATPACSCFTSRYGAISVRKFAAARPDRVQVHASSHLADAVRVFVSDPPHVSCIAFSARSPGNDIPICTRAV